MQDTLFNRTWNVEELNKLLKTDPKTVVTAAEDELEKSVEQAADAIRKAGKGRQIVLLSGPSASGKTTFAAKICGALARFGREAKRVSIDDFYKGLSEIPRNEDGTYDMESISGLDVELVQKCLTELLETGFSRFPIFDFEAQERSDRWNDMTLSEDGILVIEGIYALCPILSETLPGENLFRLSVRPETNYDLGGEPFMPPQTIRLMRRMIRDEKFRNWSAEKTLAQWASVREGEHIYVNPYRDTSELFVDTSMDFEPALFGRILSPMLKNIEENSPYFPAAEELLEKLSVFEPLSAEILPENSILHEFIG